MSTPTISATASGLKDLATELGGVNSAVLSDLPKIINFSPLFVQELSEYLERILSMYVARLALDVPANRDLNKHSHSDLDFS